MTYQISYTDTANRQVRQLPGKVRQRVRDQIKDLATNPHPPRSKELRGMPGQWRVPLDQWRIIYYIDEDHQIVTIQAIRRKTGPEIYEDLL